MTAQWDTRKENVIKRTLVEGDVEKEVLPFEPHDLGAFDLGKG